MALNNQIISSISGNLVANGDGNITGANIANITSNLQTFISNNGTDIKSVSIQSSTDANFTANYTLTLPVDEGTAGQILATDGSGVLSWETISPSSIANGNSNVNIPDANGNVNISAVGNANVLVVTGTGANIAGTANITGNANIANLGTAFAEISIGNIGTVNTGLVQNGNSNITITANANITLTAKSNVVMVISDTGANITGTANVTGDILASANVNVTSNINGARFQNGNSNIVITSNANITLTAKSNSTMVISDTGANITGTGNISGNLSAGNISTAALTATGNIDFTGDNVSLGAVGNLHITGGSSGLVLTTDGSGNLSWGTGVVAAAIANGTSNVSIPSSGGNVDISVAGNANILVVTGTGANITGTANVTGDVLAGANINVTSNINGAKFQNGNSNIAITANANITLTAKSNATMVISDTSANVTGNLDVSGFINAAVIKNNNSNITLFDGGNLQMTSNGNIIMNVSDSGNGIYINGIGNFTGNVNAANFVGVLANGNSSVAITSNANVTITSKSNATMIVTDTGANITGTLNATGNANVGNLGTTTAIITTGNISTINSGLLQNGNSNIAISASSNVTISAIGNADVVTVTGSNVVLANAVALTFIGNNGTALRQVNVKASTNANFSANYSLTLPANTGTSGQLLSTDGTGLLSWANPGGSSASISNGTSNVNIASSGGNVDISVGGTSNVLVVTGTGANITGTLNATGNANVGNLGTTTAIITTGNITTINTGLVQNGNSNIVITSNANVTITSKSNAVMVITDTGANITGTGNFSGETSAIKFLSTFSIGDEGGEIFLAKPQSNTTIAGTGVVVDIYQNKLRFFEEGGSTRGYYLDITAGSSGAGTNIIGGGGGGSNIVNGSSNVDIPTSGGNVNTSVAGNANVFVVTGTGANLAGIANVTGNIIGGEKLLVGTGTSSLADPAAVFQGSSSLFVQVALFNSQGTGSADLVAYGNNGDDTQSWTDMGFTGNTFSDANYTVTGAGDGYLFVQGNASFGGNLVIATGDTGTTKDIIFATGGFQTGNIKARLYNANGLLSVTGNISSGNANLGNLVTANYFSGQANLLTVDGGNAVGFRNVPINEQSAAYTTVLSDSGKAIFHPDGDAIRTYTIDSNANVAYPLGTVLTFINMSANAVTIDINVDTLYLAGNGATGSRTLAQYGMASAIKMTTSASNTWIISGSGLT